MRVISATNRERSWTAIALLLTSIISATAAAQDPCDGGPADLNLWTAESYAAVDSFPAGNWVVQAGGASVEQVENGQPTLFYSDFDAFGTEITGQVRVETIGDDDFVGFALGFQPGDATNPNADYLLVDWKHRTQAVDFGPPSSTPGSTAPAGLAVSRVTGIPTADEFWGHVDFDHPSSPLGDGLVELQRGLTLGSTGWASNTTYDFTFVFGAGRLMVFVDNVLEIDIGGVFTNGRLAFYNFSQDSAHYNGFTVIPMPSITAPPPIVVDCERPGGTLATNAMIQTWLDSAVAQGGVGTLVIDNDATSFFPSGCEPGRTTTVEFTATDDCDSVASATSTVTVRDITPPMVICRDDLQFTCATDVPTPDLPLVRDACHLVPTAEFVDEVDNGGSGCPGDPLIITRTFSGTDNCNNTATCSQTITVVDDVGPTARAALEPVPPDPAALPASPDSACSPPDSRAFFVRCGGSGACSGDLDLTALLLVTQHEVDAFGNCSDVLSEIPVECDEAVEIRLAAPACPARSPQTAGPPVAVNSDGSLVVTGVQVVLEVSGTDDCGVTAAATFDPATEPSLGCPPEDQLEDGTCCPAIGRPESDCGLPPCATMKRLDQRRARPLRSREGRLF